MKDMKSIALIVLMLALCSEAMALQLSGAAGRATLEDVANNTFNQTFNAAAPENLGEPSSGAVLEEVAGIINRTFNATKTAPGNLSQPSIKPVLENVTSMTNQTSNATEIPPENLSEPSIEPVLKNVTSMTNQTFNATEIPPENLSEPAGEIVPEKPANETRNQTLYAPAAARSNLSGGLGKAILSRLASNQTLNASPATDIHL